MRIARPFTEDRVIPESELIINPDGTLYHIKLGPEHVADHVILVGDQGRVKRISKHFNQVEAVIENREFVTHVGTYNGTRFTVISTGIGTDNIDIVLNELDAAVNVDLRTRQAKTELRELNIVRIGTSGAMQADIPVDKFVASKIAMGIDTVLHFYQTKYDSEELELQSAFAELCNWPPNAGQPYFVKGSESLLSRIAEDMVQGITASAPGFYGPQGRTLRLVTSIPDLNEQLTAFNHNSLRITNFEMETSALYGLGALLGHQCCTVCAIIANRLVQEYSKDHKMYVDELILLALNRLSS